jgi:ABC-type lipoprotein release transport system permease subunit
MALIAPGPQSPLSNAVMDPLAVAGSVRLLLVAATIAAILPAQCAASTDPMHVMKME